MGMETLVQMLSQAPHLLQGLNPLLQPHLSMVLIPVTDVIKDLFVYGVMQHRRSSIRGVSDPFGGHC